LASVAGAAILILKADLRIGLFAYAGSSPGAHAPGIFFR